MQRAETTSEDQIKIKTLCEYLFFDQFQDTATFPRFEQCFQPLFNNVNISMETVFKDICGEKKKYISYKRFAKAYLRHKSGNDPSPDTNTFFTTLLSKIMKEEKQFVGKTTENSYSFSTVKSCNKRECVTMAEILSDKNGKIHGVNLEYDGVFKSKMYPPKIEDELIVSLEMSLGIVDEKPIKEQKIGKFLGIKQGNYRDGVTHIFGTFNPETGFITFLGFKCISGKTVFVGFPEGDGFLYGKFGYKFHNLKLQMTADGITKLEPGFKPNVRKNFFLEKFLGKLLNQNLDKEEVIKDEAQLANLKDDVAIDQLITTPVVEDDHFFNEKLKDEISGSDYKEVVDQHPRNWILRSKARKKSGQKKPITLADALKGYNEEHENRAPSKLRARKLRSAPKTDTGEMMGSGRKIGKKKTKEIGNNQQYPQQPGFGGMPPHGMPMTIPPSGGLIGGPLATIPPMGAPQPGPFPMGDTSSSFTPWLHRTKAFAPKPSKYGGHHHHHHLKQQHTKLRGKKKWNGKIEKKTPYS